MRAREVKEEAQLTAVRVRYLASQPWPFLSVSNGVELEEARRIPRQNARSVLDGNDSNALSLKVCNCPSASVRLSGSEIMPLIRF